MEIFEQMRRRDKERKGNVGEEKKSAMKIFQ